jgi:hypothetical protein
VGFINVYRNGVLLGSADYTATNGTTVVLTTGATAGDLVTVESFLVSSVLNAIPATAGSVSDSNIVSVSASKLTGTQTIPWGTLPTGSVLQVVNGTTSVQNGNATSTFIDTGLTATITPKFTTSKILVLVSQNGVYRTGSNAGQAVQIKLVRGSTAINLFSVGSGYTGTAIENTVNSSTCYLDSPATISATTYKTQYAAYVNTSAAYVQTFSETSSITLLEIAA